MIAALVCAAEFAREHCPATADFLLAYADWLSRKTGKFYRPMKSGGWSRSNAAESRGADARYGQDDDNDDEPGARDCGNRGEWRWKCPLRSR